jgi:hypothetical protein
MPESAPSYLWSVVYDPTRPIPLYEEWTLKLTNITPNDIYYEYNIALVEPE